MKGTCKCIFSFTAGRKSFESLHSETRNEAIKLFFESRKLPAKDLSKEQNIEEYSSLASSLLCNQR